MSGLFHSAEQYQALSTPSAVEVSRLLGFGRRLRRELLIRGARRFLGSVLLAVFVTVVLDRWLRFGWTTLGVLRVAALVFLAIALWRTIGNEAVARWRVLDLASALDRAIGRDAWLTRRFATLLQLGEQVDGQSESRALVALAVDRSRTELAGFDYEAHLNQGGARRERRVFGSLAALSLLLALVSPSTTWIWLQRWVFGLHANWPQDTHLVVEGLRDGALVVPRGEGFELRVKVEEGSVVPDEVRLRASMNDGFTQRSVLKRFGEGDFRYGFSGLTTDGLLWLEGGDARLGPIPLHVRERPRVAEYVLTARLGTAGLEQRTEFTTQDRDLAFLSGTSIVLEARADQPVEALSIAGLEDLDVGSLTPERLAPDRFLIAWTQRRALSLALTLKSVETGLNSRPQRLSIGLRSDRPPRVTLARTGVGDRVTPHARIPCRVIVQDDFGVGAVELALATGGWGVGAEEALWSETLLVAETDAELERSLELGRVVPLSALGLEVGAVVQVIATARDRSHLGEQEGTARPVVLRVVEPSQLMAEIAARLHLARSRFRKARNEAQELRNTLAEDKTTPNLAQVLRRHRLVDRTVWQTARTLSESLTELVLNALIEEQARELLRQRALDPLEFLQEELMSDQRADLERSLSGEDVDDGILVSRQDRIVEEMDRVLKGMEQWDSFVDLINHLNEIIRMQAQVKDGTGETK